MIMLSPTHIFKNESRLTEKLLTQLGHVRSLNLHAEVGNIFIFKASCQSYLVKKNYIVFPIILHDYYKKEFIAIYVKVGRSFKSTDEQTYIDTWCKDVYILWCMTDKIAIGTTFEDEGSDSHLVTMLKLVI